jgi:hypothetical protein
MCTSVPDPPGPHVFGPPGSGSITRRYRSGSGSFYHQAKIVRKTLIPTVLLLLLDFLSLKNYVNVPLKSNKQKNFFINFLLASSRLLTKLAGSGSESGSISQMHGSADPDPLHRSLLGVGGRGGVTVDGKVSKIDKNKTELCTGKHCLGSVHFGADPDPRIHTSD